MWTRRHYDVNWLVLQAGDYEAATFQKFGKGLTVQLERPRQVERNF